MAISRKVVTVFMSGFYRLIASTHAEKRDCVEPSGIGPFALLREPWRHMSGIGQGDPVREIDCTKTKRPTSQKEKSASMDLRKLLAHLYHKLVLMARRYR